MLPASRAADLHSKKLMNSSHPHSCENVIAVADEPHHHLVVENKVVRAYAVEIGPHLTTLCHLHALPYLLYVAGEAEIVSVPRNREAERQHYSADHCEFAPPGLEHVVENLADKPFRNLIFEMLPATGKLHRLGLGFTNVAGVHIAKLYSGEAICAELITLSSGSQAEIAGPAVIASPYEEACELISGGQGKRRVEHFRDLQYLPEGTSALLRCDMEGPARVLAVTLGRR
jgi:hypothetical protein